MSDRGSHRSGDGPPPTRRGYELPHVVSALQKAIRRGQEEAAVYWALEMDNSGFTAYAFRRLAVIASEDVGLAEPTMPAVIEALRSSWERERQHRKGARGGLFLVHATLALCRARKSRIVDNALISVGDDRQRREVPDVALDVHTQRGRQMGRGWGHFVEESGLLADRETGELGHGCLPDPYRERAEAVLRAATLQQESPGQLTIEEER